MEEINFSLLIEKEFGAVWTAFVSIITLVITSAFGIIAKIIDARSRRTESATEHNRKKKEALESAIGAVVVDYLANIEAFKSTTIDVLEQKYILSNTASDAATYEEIKDIRDKIHTSINENKDAIILCRISLAKLDLLVTFNNLIVLASVIIDKISELAKHDFASDEYSEQLKTINEFKATFIKETKRYMNDNGLTLGI